MGIYWKYFRTVVRHKWFVLLCTRKAGFTMLGRLLVHDMSKFLPDEFFPYARYWGKTPKTRTSEDIAAYKKAKGKHEQRNRHHYEYWFGWTKDEYPYIDPMDGISIIEMFCDWRAAGFAYNGVDDSREYFIRKGPGMTLHSETRDWIEQYYEVAWNKKQNIYQKWSKMNLEDFD